MKAARHAESTAYGRARELLRLLGMATADTCVIVQPERGRRGGSRPNRSCALSATSVGSAAPTWRERVSEGALTAVDPNGVQTPVSLMMLHLGATHPGVARIFFRLFRHVVVEATGLPSSWGPSRPSQPVPRLAKVCNLRLTSPEIRASFAFHFGLQAPGHAIFGAEWRKVSGCFPKNSRFAETIDGDWFDRHCRRPYQEFESLSLRQPAKVISYFDAETARKLGGFPVFCPPRDRAADQTRRSIGLENRIFSES